MSSLLGFVTLIGSATEQVLGYLEHHHWFFGVLEHVSAEQNRKVPYRIKGFPRGCLWVSLLALILFWRLSDAKFVFCRDARASHRKS
jgi:hypothetical protein